MNNQDRVLHYIKCNYPRKLTNSDIVIGTGIQPHQQVFQLTQKLLNVAQIQGIQIGNKWRFWAAHCKEPKDPNSNCLQTKVEPASIADRSSVVTPAQFEKIAAVAMGCHFGVTLDKGKIPGVNKTFDLVSPDHKFVGDAKYFTMVRGKKLPPAKFSVIAEYVWLLEHTDALIKFLVFGNDRRVPEQWLKRYGSHVLGVQFFFLDGYGTLQSLKTS